MKDMIIAVKEEIERLQGDNGSGSHMITADIRSVSGKLFGALEDKSIEHVLSVSEELLEEHSWPMSVIAYDWAYRKRKEFRPDTFAVFEQWLANYVRGWGDCDDFCTHAFGELICMYPELLEKVKLWCNREEFWMRRAAAVILIPMIRHGREQILFCLSIADTLMQDEHDLVLKGYGWMLKVLSQKEPDEVFRYLKEKKECMPRVAFRYALEKLKPEKKAILMTKSDPYVRCPEFETERFRLRLIKKEDTEQLFEVYRDKDAVLLMNSDHCNDDFYYPTLELMEKAVDFWIYSYQSRWFIRLSIVDKLKFTVIGTIEIFGGGCGVLRIDIAKDYEKLEFLKQLYQLAAKEFFLMVGNERMVTKAITEASERRKALVECGWNSIDQFRQYQDYYELNLHI